MADKCRGCQCRRIQPFFNKFCELREPLVSNPLEHGELQVNYIRLQAMNHQLFRRCVSCAFLPEQQSDSLTRRKIYVKGFLLYFSTCHRINCRGTNKWIVAVQIAEYGVSIRAPVENFYGWQWPTVLAIASRGSPFWGESPDATRVR